MKKSSIARLLDIPGARVSLPKEGLKIDGKPASTPWFDGTREVGILMALPRAGQPMTLDKDDPLQFGRYIAPALLDTFERVPTFRKFLGLKESEPGAYLTPVESDSEGIGRNVVRVLRNMPKDPDWKRQLTFGIADGLVDCTVNAIPVTDGAAAWAAAIVEAVEIANTNAPTESAPLSAATEASNTPIGKARRK